MSRRTIVARTRFEFDINGMPRSVVDVAGMLAPVRCRSCGTVYDSANVEVIARYADCDRWKQPCCSAIGDNRPVGWGGTVDRLDRNGRVRGV